MPMYTHTQVGIRNKSGTDGKQRRYSMPKMKMALQQHVMDWALTNASGSFRTKTLDRPSSPRPASPAGSHYFEDAVDANSDGSRCKCF